MGTQKIINLVIMILVTMQIQIHALDRIKKIYFHHKDEQNTLEPAQLSLYFSHDPHLVEKKPTMNLTKGKETFIFVIKNLLPIDDEKVKQALHNVNTFKGVRDGSYHITIKENPNLQQAIIMITINPEKIALKSNIYDAITEDKGLIIHLYDRSMLDKLKNCEHPLLRLAHCKPRVLIDCGHGGDDIGGVGYKGAQEKNICLQIGLQVASQLKRKGIVVQLTRKKDMSVLLPQRTYYAHPVHADALISIHANYASSARAEGVESFYLSEKIFQEQDNSLTKLEKDRLACYKTKLSERSKLLTTQIHKKLIENIEPHYAVTDRGVKSQMSQLLLASEIPATLIEVGFLSHPVEGKHLTQRFYQNAVAKGIVYGILNYFSSVNSLSSPNH